jgi:hypothetical protein
MLKKSERSSNLKSEAPHVLEPHVLQHAAELLERQRDWITKLENVVRAFDRAALHTQPSAGDPAQDAATISGGFLSVRLFTGGNPAGHPTTPVTQGVS